MAACHVIIPGRPNDDPLGPTGTVGLILDGPAVILVDAGDPWNGAELISVLQKKFRLSPDDVTHVTVTHGHLDHCANLGLFQKARIIMDWDIGRRIGNKAEYTVVEKFPLRISDNVELLNLAGHTASDTIAIVRSNCKNTVIYAGDLIEDSQDLDLWDFENSENSEAELQKSKEFIFGTADFIIPGHGPPFRNSDRPYFSFFSFWTYFMANSLY